MGKDGQRGKSGRPKGWTRRTGGLPLAACYQICNGLATVRLRRHPTLRVWLLQLHCEAGSI